MDNYAVVNSVSESCPMEIDSQCQETAPTYWKLPQSTELLPVVKSDEFNTWTANSRSSSLPTLTGGVFRWDQKRSVAGKDPQSFDHQQSPTVSLNRSFSYEQCSLAGNCAGQSDPYVKLCTVEQKLEYYSPKRWKRTLVVETLTFSQESDASTSDYRCTKHLSSNEVEKKVTGSRLRNVVYPLKSRPCSSHNNIIDNHFIKFFLFFAIPAFLLFFSALMLRVSIFGSTGCEVNLDLEDIELTLSREIFGQNLALTSFLDALKEIFLLSDGANNSTMSVIMFIGGTGVGKSYTASLINELYPASWIQIYLNAQVDLIQEETKAKALEEILSKLTVCGTNLIIIDDAADFIRSHSTKNRENFMEQLYFAAQHSNKKILLMLMLNDKKGVNLWNDKIQLSHHVSETVSLLKSLGDIQTYTIQFTPLNGEHIMKCIRKSLEKEGISVFDEEISALLAKESAKSFPNGCKGIYKYVHELSIKNLSENIHSNF